MKEIKNEYVFYSFMVGALMYGNLGMIFTVVLLIIILMISMIVIERSFKEKAIKLTLRTVTYVLGIAFMHFFIYFRLKYNF